MLIFTHRSTNTNGETNMRNRFNEVGYEAGEKTLRFFKIVAICLGILLLGVFLIGAVIYLFTADRPEMPAGLILLFVGVAIVYVLNSSKNGDN